MTKSDISVLLVEDEKSLRDVYEMVLSAKGIHVESAVNGVDAYEKLKNYEPDLILLDYFMPVMDGKTFLKNFDESQYPDVKIIVATNVSDKKVLDEMLSLGAHSYILKAKLSPTELVTLVKDSV